MKRKLTLFLSAVMVASSLPMTAYAANFKDINDVPWDGVQSVINSVADKGLLGGYEDNTFRARNNVTYCEAMQMVYKTMTKSGMAEPVSAMDIYSYTATLNTLKVPVWAHTAVAYGLKNGIIDLTFVAQNFGNNGSKVATREDVALIFGNALAPAFGKEKAAPAAKTFADYWSISVERLEQVDILKRLNILAGDEYGRFNPKKNINRAEMAVMLNKTYNVLAEGVSLSGEIIELYTNNDVNYSITIEQENGREASYLAAEGETPVYSGTGSTKISLAKLSEGDDVTLMISGDKLISIRLVEKMAAQEKHDVTGYIYSYKGDELTLENENTGETEKYTANATTAWYLDGKRVSRSDIREELEERTSEHAYVGLDLKVERERINGTYTDVVYVDEAYVTFTDGYTVTGEVKTFSEKSIGLKLSGVSATKDYILADGCSLYLGENKASISEVKKLIASGTTFAKVDIDNKEKATKIIFSEDTFGTGVTYEDSLSDRHKVGSFSQKKMVLQDGSDKLTYEFGTENPVSQIAFYIWDTANAEWDEVSIGTAESYVDDPEGDNGVYCKVGTNKGGKLTEVYLSYSRNAWENTSEFQNERKGTVVSIVDDVLKFKTGTAGYKLLNKYDGDLMIKGAFSNTKTVLTRLANDSSVELYAEITADGNNKAQRIDATIKKITGELVEYNRDNSPFHMIIRTEDGNEHKVKAVKFVKITNDEDLTAEDLASSKYYGSEILAEFNTSGSIDKVTILENSHEKIEDYVTGIAKSTTDRELTLESRSTKYIWRTEADTDYTNYSMSTTSALYKLRDLINDKDTTVSVKLRPDEKNRIDEIDVYVTAAKGVLDNYDEDSNLIRIKTADGNTFTFDTVSKPTIDVDDATETTLDRVGDGKTVKLTFNSNGKVTKIEKV